MGIAGMQSRIFYDKHTTVSKCKQLTCNMINSRFSIVDVELNTIYME